MRKFTLLLTLLMAFMTTAIAQIDTSKEYRVKHTTTGKVMNASNYDAHPTGPLGGVNFVEEAESDDQVFLFEADGTGYKLKTKSGKYIYCQAWNVDALDQASTLTFSNNGDGTYKIGCDKGYFKVENVTGSPVVKENGAEVTKEQVSGYFPFCDAGYTAAANFELVEVEAGTPEVPATPLEVVSVSPSEAVNALSELTITFNQDVAGQFDQYAMVAMKLKKGTGVASGVSNYVVDGAVLTVTLSQEVTEAGEYTLVIPEGLITRKSDGAAYSGEHKFTVAEATPEVPAGPVVITDVAQLSNAKCYTLVSSDTGRGGMYALADKVDMCGVTYNAGTDACHSVALDNADPKQQFAFVEYEGKLYLYSVSEKKFVMKSGDTNALVGEAPFEHVVVEKVGENTFALQANGTHYFTASPGWCANPSRGTCVQSTLNSHSSADGWDDGAWYTITEVADFDATEALALLNPSAPVGPSAAEVTALLETAQQALALNGVGYPVEAEREVVETAMAALEGEATQANYDELVAKLTAYATTTNIQMPESGKAYRIKAKYSTGSYKYMYRTDAGKMQVTTTEPSGYNGTFIFKKNDDGTYAVVNNYGEYMTYYADGKTGVGGTNDGFAPQYENGNYNADMKFIIAVDKTPTSGTKDSWLGGFLIQGRNTSGDGGNNYYYLMAGPNSDFHNAGVNDIFYSSGNLTSVFYLEEVEYPNNVTLASFEGSQLIRNLEGNTIGTFSAPFPTVLPTGVTAYYAHQNTGELISLTEVETAAIPANQGVILVGTTAETTKALMVPATSEQPANLSSNLFQNSAGRKAGMEEGDFILARGSQGIGFYPVNIDNSNGTEGTTLAMNKAFLRMGTSNVAAFRLVVDEEVTAIDGVTTEKADAPIYDLSGRRVLNTIKGGIYIQNGKKFIVK